MEKYSHLALIPKNYGSYNCYLPNIQTVTADFDLGELTANVETIVKDAFDDWAYQNCESPKAMTDEEAIRETEALLDLVRNFGTKNLIDGYKNLARSSSQISKYLAKCNRWRADYPGR